MNSVEKDLEDIRRLTRIALPASHRYVYSLGCGGLRLRLGQRVYG